MSKKYDFALVSGGFDPVHLGHLEMIKGARLLADCVVVLLNSDNWLTRKKGKPFMNEQQRTKILLEFSSVHRVIVQDKDQDDSSNRAIEDFAKKNIEKKICYCNGGDRNEEKQIRESEICKKLGIDLKFSVGGNKKIESSSNLTKNYLAEVEKRPWGQFHIIAKGDGYQVKEINVKKDRKQSLQKHKYRSECWQIIKGMCKIQVGKEIFILCEGKNIFIPQGEIHRIENIGDEELKLVEIQIGDRIEEEDITRIEDDYGRV